MHIQGRFEKGSKRKRSDDRESGVAAPPVCPDAERAVVQSRITSLTAELRHLNGLLQRGERRSG